MRTIIVTLLLSGTFSAARAETFRIDPAHSNVSFSIRHMMVSRVRGRFAQFDGALDYAEGKPRAWKASATIDASSIDTGIEKRDAHLRTADFFDVAKCPDIRFVSDRATDVQGDKFKLHGNLTIHCVTNPVTLDVEFGGATPDPWGNLRIGASATARISRKDFGLTWNKALDKGGVMLGDDIDISIDVEATAPKK